MIQTAPADFLSILDKRDKSLPSDRFSYKLIEGEYAGHYGLDYVSVQQPEFDESKMSVWIPYACGQNRDGIGDVLRVEGINNDRHHLNAIVLFDHGKNIVLPLGKTNPYNGKQYVLSEYLDEIDPISQTARGNAFFYQGKGLVNVDRRKEYDHAVFCMQMFHMSSIGLVTGGSIGYQTLRAEPIPPDYRTGTPQGLDLQAVRKLEISLVIMPANALTVRKNYDPTIVEKVCRDGICCGKPVAPYLMKSLTAAIPDSVKTKVISGYEGKVMKSQIAGDLNWLKEEQSESEHKKFPEFEESDYEHKSTSAGESRSHHNCGCEGSCQCELKAMRAKYKAIPQPTSHMEGTGHVQSGDTVIARSWLSHRNHETGKHEPIAKSGESLEILDMSPDGFLTVKNKKTGKQGKVHESDVRRSKGRKTGASQHPSKMPSGPLKPGETAEDREAQRAKIYHEATSKKAGGTCEQGQTQAKTDCTPKEKALSDPNVHRQYENPLSRSNVPPSRWKPGAGAIKAMRLRYRKKAWSSTGRYYDKYGGMDKVTQSSRTPKPKEPELSDEDIRNMAKRTTTSVDKMRARSNPPKTGQKSLRLKYRR